MPAVKQIVLGAPEASVDIHRDWKGPLAFRKPEITELVGIAAVGETNIGWRWLQSEDVFGHTDSGTGCIWRGSQLSDFRFQICRQCQEQDKVLPPCPHPTRTIYADV